MKEKDRLLMDEPLTWAQIKNKIEGTLDQALSLADDREKKQPIPEEWLKLFSNMSNSRFGDGIMCLTLNHPLHKQEGAYKNSWIQFRISAFSFSVVYHDSTGKVNKSIDSRIYQLNTIGKAKLFWFFVSLFSKSAMRLLEADTFAKI